MSEPEKLYRVVEYLLGDVYPVSNYYKNRAKAREWRTRRLNAHREWYGAIWDVEANRRVPNPKYSPPIYGIQMCVPEWKGIG